MSIVKQKDTRSGITYIDESQSYWDKERKQSRSKRRLIGRLDEETGAAGRASHWARRRYQ